MAAVPTACDNAEQAQISVLNDSFYSRVCFLAVTIYAQNTHLAYLALHCTALHCCYLLRGHVVYQWLLA